MLLLWFDEEEHVLQAAIAVQGITLANSIMADDFVKRDSLLHRSDVKLVCAEYTALCVPDQQSIGKINTFLSCLTTNHPLIENGK